MNTGNNGIRRLPSTVRSRMTNRLDGLADRVREDAADADGSGSVRQPKDAGLMEAIGRALGDIDAEVPVEELLAAMCALVGHRFEVAAAVTLEDTGQATFSWATSDAGRRTAQAQLSHHQGPLIDARTSGTLIEYHARDVARRWPLLTSEVSALGGEHGVAASLNQDSGSTVVQLTWSDGDARSMRQFAEGFMVLLGDGLRLRSRLTDMKTTVDQLQIALDRRVRTEQAKGYVSAAIDVEPEQAFLLLRQHARAERCKLAELVEDVLAGRRDPRSLTSS